MRWKKWNGEDLGRLVLVKTEDGNICTAQQPIDSMPEEWVVYVPGMSMILQPILIQRVEKYAEINHMLELEEA